MRREPSSLKKGITKTMQLKMLVERKKNYFLRRGGTYVRMPTIWRMNPYLHPPSSGDSSGLQTKLSHKD